MRQRYTRRRYSVIHMIIYAKEDMQHVHTARVEVVKAECDIAHEKYKCEQQFNFGNA